MIFCLKLHWLSGGSFMFLYKYLNCVAVNNDMSVLIGTELDLKIAFGLMIIFRIVPRHEHRRSFYSPIYSAISLHSIFQLLL